MCTKMPSTKEKLIPGEGQNDKLFQRTNSIGLPFNDPFLLKFEFNDSKRCKPFYLEDLVASLNKECAIFSLFKTEKIKQHIYHNDFKMCCLVCNHFP